METKLAGLEHGILTVVKRFIDYLIIALCCD